MGKWNNRYYLPRNNKYNRHYDYEDPPYEHTHSYSSGVDDSRWEVNYCKSVRVPWNKVLASKYLINSYPSVQNWDDSAGKETFENAKRRYWARINGLPCDNPLPDPDIFIDAIDWNPYIDPDLMEDLDRQFFNPDEDHKLKTINEEIGCEQMRNDGNPWERDHVQDSRDVIDGWGQWVNPVNLESDNPWEQRGNQLADSSKENAWRSGNESWGCSNGNAKRNISNCGNSWGNNNGNRSRGGWRDSEFRGDGSNHWGSKRFKEDGRTFNGGCRKRESSLQHTSKNKSSRYQGYNYGDSR
ncbi:hypothetical protein ACJIZ3_016041 [Penstemon smallii]|uniref:Uncharacterized protein n=1 Tax=Penstemon smallii TaxID=265156 RepID=A0ABD3RPE4_9LAMI